MKETFAFIDKNKDGQVKNQRLEQNNFKINIFPQIDRWELQELVQGLGINVTEEDVVKQIESYDIDRNGFIDFGEVTKIANLFYL